MEQREVSHNLLQQLPHLLCLVLLVSIEDESDLAMRRALLCSAAEVADACLHLLAELLQGLVRERLLEEEAEADAGIQRALLCDMSQLTALRAAAQGRVVGRMQLNVPSPQLVFEVKTINDLGQLLLLHHAREHIEDEASSAVLLRIVAVREPEGGAVESHGVAQQPRDVLLQLLDGVAEVGGGVALQLQHLWQTGEGRVRVAVEGRCSPCLLCSVLLFGAAAVEVGVGAEGEAERGEGVEVDVQPLVHCIDISRANMFSGEQRHPLLDGSEQLCRAVGQGEGGLKLLALVGSE